MKSPKRSEDIEHSLEPNGGSKYWWQDGKTLAWLGAILAITFVCYWPALGSEFLRWDDPVYVTSNAYITHLSVHNITAMFTQPMVHPLTMLSLATNYAFSGLSPMPYHLTNVLLHLVNVCLTFFLARRLLAMDMYAALLTAFLFGIHPMHVESVAWVSGRKDVLFALFFLGAMLAYLAYLDRKSRRAYVLCLVCFILSLLSKPTAVILPIVLLLLDFLFSRPFSRGAILEKAPYFALSVVFGLITVDTLSDATITSMTHFSFIERVQFASYGFVTYLWKFFLPLNLSAFYPYPTEPEHYTLGFTLAPLGVLVLSAAAFWTLRHTRLVMFGFLFYAAGLVLTLQFVTVNFALMADRYTYLPYTGLALVIAAGLRHLLSQRQQLLYPICVGVSICVGVLGYLCFERTHVWRDGNTLWTDVIEKYPGRIAQAYSQRGQYFHDHEKPGEAIDDFRMALEIDPRNYDAQTDLAIMYSIVGQFAEGVANFGRAIEIAPERPEAYANRAAALMALLRNEDALIDLTRSIELNPMQTVAYENRAIVYTRKGQHDLAAMDFSELLARNPRDEFMLNSRAIAYSQVGRHAEAIADLTAAIEISPQTWEYYLNRSYARNTVGDRAGALADIKAATDRGANVNPEYLRSLQQ